MIASIVYILCASASVVCATMLLINFRKKGTPLLLWSALCFVGFALSNIILFVDKVLAADVDLSIVRTVPTLLGVYVLIWGLNWDSV